ncbi:hypothetical protein [Pseudomonas sp. GM84]|uniref:hypothetical protein n=1 Tax=Pseudomonas sp. GM84 TaxID=1144340 RepID=UPI001EE66BF7|nr:hypothetical protein [Pseudomonas sp. GM84]
MSIASTAKRNGACHNGNGPSAVRCQSCAAINSPIPLVDVANEVNWMRCADNLLRPFLATIVVIPR